MSQARISKDRFIQKISQTTNITNGKKCEFCKEELRNSYNRIIFDSKQYNSQLKLCHSCRELLGNNCRVAKGVFEINNFYKNFYKKFLFIESPLMAYENKNSFINKMYVSYKFRRQIYFGFDIEDIDNLKQRLVEAKIISYISFKFFQINAFKIRAERKGFVFLF